MSPGDPSGYGLATAAGEGLPRGLRMPAGRGRRAHSGLARLLAFALGALPVVATLPVAAAERPFAEPFLGMPAESTLGSDTQWDVVEAYPGLVFDDPVFVLAEPGADRLWVAEREGRLVSFQDDEAATELKVVLDLRDVTLGDGDSGMLSMAFHPGYAGDDPDTEGLIFVAYARMEKDDEDAPLRFRVSRFRVDRATGVADPASELVLVEQLDQNTWHQGGAVFFHPEDGYLYVSVGDEGGGRCMFGNCQRIDRDLFSGVLRLDVDCRPGSSHAPPRQPLTGATAHYCIPDDNPFVGVKGALEEFYALGLRSPHRMTHDPVDDLVWIGDVGQSEREEIDVLAPGANFQWNVMEGTIEFPESEPLPVPPIGAWTPPVLDYGREAGGTVIGGYVYRGKALPELEGRYIYGDFLSGRLWALRYDKTPSGVSVVSNTELVRTGFRGRTDGITSLGVDGNGEILVLTLGATAKLQRLVASRPGPGDMPTTLSATGLFEDLAALRPIDALVPYDVAVPLWSDGTRKKRWMSVPTGSTIAYSPARPWRFPAGSVFVKHFEIALDAAAPDVVRRLETRVLVRRNSGGAYGVTYRWREDGSDADLLTGALVEELSVRDAGGAETVQRYLYPGPRDCESCHHDDAGTVLGLRARQLAGMPVPTDDSPQVAAAPRAVAAPFAAPTDALGWFAEAGYFDVGPGALDRGAIPSVARVDDEAASPELRVRSYLDSNCSHCHGYQSIDRSSWDARVTTPLNRQGIVGGVVLGEYGSEDHRVVAPGSLDLSVLWLRAHSTTPGMRMPPLARSVRDEAFLAVLEQWIAEVDPGDLPPLVCGDIAEPWDRLTVSDVLAVLRASVELGECPSCLCDVDSNGGVSVSDAFRVLKRSVGIAQAMACVPCVAP